ncbi:MAG: malto-oligosyltrehalose synthase, partial [Dehalococcoidia bacterium]
PEFGGEEAYDRLVEAQRALGLGQVVDIVPNHMGVAPGSGNAAWEDVLRLGQASPWAHVFDIDWTPADPALHGRVVLPVLGEPLDALLDRGEVGIEVDGHEGWATVYGIRYPLDPATVEAWRARGEPRDRAALAALLDAQHYHLEFWKDAHEHPNYRRFFVIDDLAAVRAEDPRVFEYTHRLALDLVRDGAIDGLRIDHPDGLLDPEEYLGRLRAALAEAGAPEAYVVVEKILEADEPLSETWRCHGTTGYDYMNEVVRVLTATQHEAAFTAIYQRTTGETEPYRDLAERSRVEVVEGALAPQVGTLARRLHHAARGDADAASVEVEAFARAVRTLLARIPEYRTYHRAHALDPRAALVGEAFEAARATGDGHADALAAAAALLAAPPEGEIRALVMQLQQTMPAVQAKGLEDRAFYRYRRLLALNEVGGDPGTFGESVETFHARLSARARVWPRRMLTTATHDHKRGEDARMRLAALSELPEGWHAALGRAQAVLDDLDPQRGVAAGDRYLFVQSLLGCAPAGMALGREGDEDLGDRMRDYMRKALREAAERTDWVDGDEAYEEAVDTLVADALGRRQSDLLGALEPLLSRVAHLGAVLSLAQVVLRVAAPGVPDTYQGNEGWDLSLVDPDNRRPIDFDRRRALLAALAPALLEGASGDEARRAATPELLADWRSGAVKMFTLARGLGVRRSHPRLFLDGTYEPLTVEGGRAAHVIAFARRYQDATAIAAVPRLPGVLLDEGAGDASLWRPAWDDTRLRLPFDLAATRWRNAYTGAAIEGGGTLPLSAVLGEFPVALLIGEA